MKKILAIIVAVIGILLAAIGIHWKSKAAVAVSIIGGADGPTSIFLAGKSMIESKENRWDGLLLSRGK